MEQKISAGKMNRLTKYRKIVLDVVKENPHLDAYSIHQLALERDSKISLPTVYRALKFLKENGFIVEHKFRENHAHYELADVSKQGTACVHLVCERCGKIEEAGSEELSSIKVFSSKHSFDIKEAHLTLFGYCETCKSK